MIGPTGRFTAARGFVVDGHIIARGDRFDTTDGELIGALLSAAKIEPADEATAKRIHWKAGATWTAADPALGYNPMDW